jgi:hypothetical protein
MLLLYVDYIVLADVNVCIVIIAIAVFLFNYTFTVQYSTFHVFFTDLYAMIC